MHTTSSRSANLDILRALAVLLVMLRHIHVCPPSENLFLFKLTSFFQHGGWIGVDIFFVLSGFLVGGLLFQEHCRTGRIQYGRFLIRRGFKIYPLFWLALMVVAATKVLLGNPAPASQLLADLFFIANYFKGVLGVSWSLGIEEHFYMLLPGALLVVARSARDPGQPFARIPWVVFGVCTVCLLLRVFTYSEQHFEFPVDFTPTHLRLDGLMFGVLLSYWFNQSKERFIATSRRFCLPLLGIGILGFLPAFFFPITSWYIRVPGFAVNWLAAGALVCVALALRSAKSGLASLLAAVGRHSYAIYLFHAFIGALGVPLVGRFLGMRPDWFSYAGLYLAMSLGLGAVLTWTIERPLLRIRDRLFPVPSRAIGTSGSAPSHVSTRPPSAASPVSVLP